jgi:hypothetical protein
MDKAGVCGGAEAQSHDWICVDPPSRDDEVDGCSGNLNPWFKHRPSAYDKELMTDSRSPMEAAVQATSRALGYASLLTALLPLYYL